MIQEIKVGDITNLSNRTNIIIGMNPTLEDVTGIGVPFVRKIELIHPIKLGSVLNFQFDKNRMLHMVICHNIGYGGWTEADKWVRLGLDYLWQASKDEEHVLHGANFSIIQIGAGRIGRRDGACPENIRTAMATSYLPLTLFVRDETTTVNVRADRKPLHAFSAWHPLHGEAPIRIAA